MLIVCPSCASEYTIDGSKIGPDGRKVRCASCRHEWFVHPPVQEAETGQDAPSAPKRTRLGNKAVGLRTKKISRDTNDYGGAFRRRIVSLAAVIGLFVMVSAIVAGRFTLVRLFPETARLYAAIGLPVNLRGLAFERVASRLAPQNGEPFLVVEGTVRNVTREPRELPAIEIAIRGGGRQPLYSWTSEPPVASLGPGEASTFRARLSTPPTEGRDVLVRFAPAASMSGRENPAGQTH